VRLTDEVPKGRRTPQATRTMNQFSHRARLPARRDCRKPTVPGCLTPRSVGVCILVVARRSEYLLIDVSNSYAKFAFASRERVSNPARIPTADLSRNVVAEFLRRRQIQKLVVASVVPTKNSTISKAAHNKAPVLWLDWTRNLGVTIDYPRPESIGADRLANAAAVAELYGCPAIVIDFGTAATFDVVSEGGRYIGGVIAPGLEAMTNFLYERTALLPRLALKEPRRAIGKSTVEAMRSGAVFGYRGLVREILARIKAEQSPRKKVAVVATGGYARLIASQVPEVALIHPNLTLEGLRIVGNLN
jgi:type III pantothenate kinase